MLELFKSLFGMKREEEYTPEPPGRVFNRILTGDSFGTLAPDADTSMVAKSKQDKIEKIKELDLKPMFLRYSFDRSSPEKIISAHVVFQKEEHVESRNMVYITEISFDVKQEDFEEFESMAGVNLEKDFRNLTEINNATYQGEERRKEERDYPSV
jgi:hypothetical protein